MIENWHWAGLNWLKGTAPRSSPTEDQTEGSAPRCREGSGSVGGEGAPMETEGLQLPTHPQQTLPEE